MSPGFWDKVTTRHRVANSMGGLMTLGATSQWILSVEHLPSMTATTQNRRRVTLIVPCARAFLRLLALVTVGGSGPDMETQMPDTK